MIKPSDYTFEDAIRDAVKQREEAGQLPLHSNPRQAAELEKLGQEPMPATREKMHEAIVRAIRTVYDPELPVNLYDLGLIYDIVIDEASNVMVLMTLTAPGCPVAGEIPRMVERAVRYVSGVKSVTAKLVWDPPWNKSMMSEEAMLELGFM